MSTKSNIKCDRPIIPRELLLSYSCISTAVFCYWDWKIALATFSTLVVVRLIRACARAAKVKDLEEADACNSFKRSIDPTHRKRSPNAQSANSP